MRKALKTDGFLILIFLATLLFFLQEIITYFNHPVRGIMISANKDTSWIPPSLFTDMEIMGEDREMVLYGEELIAHTSKYLGPEGSVARITNGMNCQNCHLEAGTRFFGNNYSAVYSTYPKYRDRSGSMESIHKRVNDCIERSLNGQAIDSNSKEMRAIIAYMKWLGKDVPKSVKPHGAGLEKLAFMNRAADPEKGRLVFSAHCSRCHGSNGEGQKLQGEILYTYPPLWGEHSYTEGAGLFRLIHFSGFVKNNMPYDTATHGNTILTNEEAWDVAAFVNSQPRPMKDQSKDWPDISKKPIDFPFGPYADSFSERQHKYGPWGEIVESQKSKVKSQK
jgi:thiosulfate dehydrogenase